MAHGRDQDGHEAHEHVEPLFAGLERASVRDDDRSSKSASSAKSVKVTQQRTGLRVMWLVLAFVLLALLIWEQAY